MSIIQISKIQQRSGNLVDLPQLDEAEFGWASDAKRLFIGKTTPNENIEVLTSYSQINYSQINGSVGNLNISNVTIGNGQVLTYDGNNWVNRGGDAGGLITLGDVSNVKITGGAIGYVLETDGLGNLSWTPKSTVIAYIQNVTQANPAVVTTTQDNFLTEGIEITITDASGMTALNGNTFYANIISSNTFSLYTDAGLSTPVNSTGYGQYSYTTATATSASTNRVTVGNSALFSPNQAVSFLGDLSTSMLENDAVYYIKTAPTGTTITVSEELLANGSAGNTKTLATASLTGANVYAVGGRAIAAIATGAGGAGGASGSNTTIQFNNNNLLDGDADFTWNSSTKLLNVVGNANIGNLNASSIVTGSRFISSIATGTAPLAVSSTTRVANLNVATAGVSDTGTVTAAGGGLYYPVFVGGNTTGNYGLASNAGLSFNASTGTLFTSILSVSGNANVANLGTGRVIATGNISGTQLISNIATGTAPLLVESTTQVANLNAATAGTATTAGTVTTNAQPNITSVGTLSGLTVSGNAFLSTSSGNVGIGTTTPGTKLDVNGTSTFSDNMLLSRTNTAGSLSGITVTNAGTTSAYAGININSGTVTSQLFNDAAGNAVVAGTILRTTTNHPLVFGTNTTEKMRIESSGNVGIGNASPAHRLSVTGTMSVSGNANIGNIGTSSILTPIITTGANTTPGTITGDWTLTTGSKLQATYADLAEYYEADATYEPGTVLMFGGEKEVTIADDGTSKVAGVVSTNPAYVMNSTCPGLLTAVALQGRVPCKVRGKISKGDMLISGGNGFARPNQFPSMGTVIGKALQDFDGYEGVIEVAVGRL
jgi:hypothetical protein